MDDAYPVALLFAFDKTDDAGMKEIREWITSMETSLQKAEQADKQYSGELDTALAEYKNLTEQAVELDADELNAARQELRPNMERDAIIRYTSCCASSASKKCSSGPHSEAK